MREVVASKILLERELYRPLTVAGRRFVTSWEVAGGQMSAWERLGHLANLEAILSRHYARVVMVMDGRRPGKGATIAEAALSLQHADSLHNRAKRQADLILRAIERELATALAEMASGGEAPDDGMGQKSIETKDEKPPLQWFEKFKRAAAAAMRKLNAKLGVVANAETNPAAEEARRIIAEGEARITNGSVLKRWISLMDGRERPAHHAAHNTYQSPITADQPFVVGGFDMMAPGDASRGAPLNLIINCRCGVAYSLLNPDGTESPIAHMPHGTVRPYRKIKPDPELLRPTSLVTLNGRTRARVVLKDGKTIATMTQVTPSTITVSVGGRVAARAAVSNGRVSRVTVDPSFRGQGIEDLIRRSVTHSAERKPQSVR